MARLICIVLLIFIANLVSGWFVDALHLELRPSNEELVHRMTMLSAGVYTLLLAIPFVPGVEIGLALIGVLGPKIAFLVYVCTMMGLFVSFLIGRLVSLKWLAEGLERLGLWRAGHLLCQVHPMEGSERLAYLVSRAPNRLIPFLLRHRYLALAIIVNLPGNIVIGGGGGISMMAGASRLYSVAGFIATTAIAVAPVPLAILLFGKEILSG